MNRIVAVKVTGNSMEPFVNNDEIVLIKECLLNECLPGDIVALMHNKDSLGSSNIIHSCSERSEPVPSRLSGICVHRLLRKINSNSHPQVVIKGDSISSFDRLKIGKEGWLIGRITCIIRDNKIYTENRFYNIIKLFLSLCLIPLQILRGH